MMTRAQSESPDDSSSMNSRDIAFFDWLADVDGCSAFFFLAGVFEDSPFAAFFFLGLSVLPENTRKWE